VLLAATFETIDLVELLVMFAVLAGLVALVIFYRPDGRSRSGRNEPDTE
jgi:hypothetical protein